MYNSVTIIPPLFVPKQNVLKKVLDVFIEFNVPASHQNCSCGHLNS